MKAKPLKNLKSWPYKLLLVWKYINGSLRREDPKTSQILIGIISIKNNFTFSPRKDPKQLNRSTLGITALFYLKIKLK